MGGHMVLLAGLALTLLLWLWRHRAGVVRHGIRVEGEIVDLKMTGLDWQYRYPVVRFQTRAGQWLTLTADERVHVSAVSKGEKVEVSYWPGAPEQFVLVAGFDLLVQPAHQPLPSGSRIAKGRNRRSGRAARPG